MSDYTMDFINLSAAGCSIYVENIGTVIYLEAVNSNNHTVRARYNAAGARVSYNDADYANDIINVLLGV